MKICTECKFCKPKRVFSHVGISYPATCENKEVLSPYDGFGYLDPFDVRKDESLCGMDARWFEQKPAKEMTETELKEIQKLNKMMEPPVLEMPDDGKIGLPKKQPFWRFGAW